MIALSLGSNDIGFGEIAAHCIHSYMTFRDSCEVKTDGLAGLRRGNSLKRIGLVLDDIRVAMAEAGQPRDSYRLVVQSTPLMLSSHEDNRYPESGWSRWTAGGCPFWNDDLEWIRTKVLETNTGLSSVAFVKQADFLDLGSTLDGREVCSVRSSQVTHDAPPNGKVHEWARFVTTGYGQGDQVESLHPNYFGQQAIGMCLRLLMNQPGPRSYDCRNTPGQGPDHMFLAD